MCILFKGFDYLSLGYQISDMYELEHISSTGYVSGIIISIKRGEKNQNES